MDTFLGFQASLVVIFSKRGTRAGCGALHSPHKKQEQSEEAVGSTRHMERQWQRHSHILLPPIPTALLPRVHGWLLALVPGRSNLQFLQEPDQVLKLTALLMWWWWW